MLTQFCQIATVITDSWLINHHTSHFHKKLRRNLFCFSTFCKSLKSPFPFSLPSVVPTKIRSLSQIMNYTVQRLSTVCMILLLLEKHFQWYFVTQTVFQGLSSFLLRWALANFIANVSTTWMIWLNSQRHPEVECIGKEKGNFTCKLFLCKETRSLTLSCCSSKFFKFEEKETFFWWYFLISTDSQVISRGLSCFISQTDCDQVYVINQLKLNQRASLGSTDSTPKGLSVFWGKLDWMSNEAQKETARLCLTSSKTGADTPHDTH